MQVEGQVVNILDLHCTCKQRKPLRRCEVLLIAAFVSFPRGHMVDELEIQLTWTPLSTDQYLICPITLKKLLCTMAQRRHKFLKPLQRQLSVLLLPNLFSSIRFQCYLRL